MPVRSSVLVLLGAALASMALAGAPAWAAPITLGTPAQTSDPGIAVDADGTGHVAWTEAKNPSGGAKLVWCRLPRGASACAATREFVPDALGSFGPVQVLIPSPGRILLIQHRCCNERTVLFESTDAGATWSDARTIGTLQPFDAALGPGPYSVSLIDDVKSAGVAFQAAPIAGGTPGSAAVGAGLGQTGDFQGYDGTVAFLDPATPVVAFTDLKNAFYRVWSGAGDYNASASWGPTTALGPGADTRLASGQSGLWISYRTGEPTRVVARRLDPATRTFGPAQTVSEQGDVLDPDLFQDASGRLHAAWERNDDDALRYRSATGGTWGATRTLETAGGGKFGLRIATAADGGGWAVWDANGQGPVRAAVIPPASASSGDAPGSANCPVTVKLTAKVEARAREGCLAKKPDGSYQSSGEVRLNGIDFRPAGGTISVNPATRVVKATGKVDVQAGNVVLHRGALTWDVDQPVKFTKLASYGVTLLGFGVTGEADVTFLSGGANIAANLRLPAFFGGVTGRTVLRTRTDDPGGLQLDGIEVTVPEANVGVLIVRHLKVAYHSDINTFEGAADLVFPPQTAKGVSVALGFKNGAFAHAEAEAGPPVPPFPLPLTSPPGPLFLQRVGVAVSAADGLRVAGGALLTLGPPFKGTGIVTVDALPPGGFTFDFPAGKGYADLSMSGQLRVVDIALAGGFVNYRTTGLLTWGGSLGLDFEGVVGINGALTGFLNVPTAAFNSASKVKICAPTSCTVKIAGISAPTPLQGTGTFVVSSKGAAGCVSVAGVGVGAGVFWGKSYDVFADGGCGLAAYQVSAGGAARIAQAGATAVTLPRGLPQAAILLRGDRGAPVVRIDGPGGATLTMDPQTEAVVRSPFVVTALPGRRATIIRLARPAAGRWTITPLPGSPAVTEVRTARGLPAPSVSAQVAGTGRRRVLRYRVRAIRGQRVTFLERSGRALGRIGVATGTAGALRFTPAEGPAGRRDVLALVEQDGLPRTQVTVARYRAPAPLRPARPRVRVQRTAGGALVRWSATSGAARYVMRVTLTDGRVLQATMPAARRRATLSAVQRTDGLRVTVTGITRGGLRGAPGSARLRRG